MDQNKLLIGFVVVVLGAFLALPLLNKDTAPAAGGGGAAAPTPVATGPDYTESTLINTAWSVQTPQGTATVQLLEGGQCVATPDSTFGQTMLQQVAGVSALSGTWSVSGKSLTVKASAGSINANITAQINGQTISANGQQAVRIQ